MNALDWTDIFRKYRGKWIAMKSDGETVVGSGATLAAAKDEAEKKAARIRILLVFLAQRTATNFIGPHRST